MKYRYVLKRKNNRCSPRERERERRESERLEIKGRKKSISNSIVIRNIIAFVIVDVPVLHVRATSTRRNNDTVRSKRIRSFGVSLKFRKKTSSPISFDAACGPNDPTSGRVSVYVTPKRRVPGFRSNGEKRFVERPVTSRRPRFEISTGFRCARPREKGVPAQKAAARRTSTRVRTCVI